MKFLIIFAIIVLVSVLFRYFWRLLGLPNFKKPTFFKDSFNRITIYRGVNICNYSKTSPDFLPWHEESDYVRLKLWGFNLVRFLVFWQAVEPEKSKYDFEYIEKVKKHISILRSLNIDVIIDLHQDLYSHKFTGNGFPDWALPPKEYPFKNQSKWWLNYFQPYVRECYKYFWSNEKLKSKYLDFVGIIQENFCSLPNVIGIDVINEPFPVLPFFWRFEKHILNKFYDSLLMLNSYYLKFFLQKPKPWFFESDILTSTGLPTLLKKSLFKTAKYIPHYYPPFCHSEGNYNKFNRLLAKISLRSKALEANRFGVPSLIGEFGICPKVKNSKQFITDFVNSSEKYFINWLWYCYDKGQYSEQGILDENGAAKDFLFDLIRVYPQKISGKNPVFYTEDNTFVLEFVNDTTIKKPTEIFLDIKYNYNIITDGKYEIDKNILRINFTKNKKCRIEIKINKGIK